MRANKDVGALAGGAGNLEVVANLAEGLLDQFQLDAGLRLEGVSEAAQRLDARLVGPDHYADRPLKLLLFSPE